MAESKRKYVRWTDKTAAEYVERVGCTLKSGYIPSKKGKMLFTCVDCGAEYLRTWGSFYQGSHRCASCGMLFGRLNAHKSQRKTSSVFQKEVKAVHGDAVEVLGSYVNCRSKIHCRCTICGNSDWFPRASHLLEGQSCPECKKKRHSSIMAKTSAAFIAEVSTLHGGKYKILGEYTKGSEKIETVCTICGNTWFPRASKLVEGTGCPNCASYRGEDALRDLMQSLQLPFKQQFTFPDCRGARGGVCRFDCAVLDSSDQSPLLLIEYDGAQHFKPVEFFGGQKEFEYRQHNDRIKDSYCMDHGIPLLRISYKQFDQIEQLVTDKLYELNILQKEAA